MAIHIVKLSGQLVAQSKMDFAGLKQEMAKHFLHAWKIDLEVASAPQALRVMVKTVKILTNARRELLVSAVIVVARINGADMIANARGIFCTLQIRILALLGILQDLAGF